jgi:hypothetical protein
MICPSKEKWQLIAKIKHCVHEGIGSVVLSLWRLLIFGIIYLTIIRLRLANYREIFTKTKSSRKSLVFFGPAFILISLISLSITSTKRLAVILQISVLLLTCIGECKSLNNQI